jgi:hypothetical protein
MKDADSTHKGDATMASTLKLFHATTRQNLPSIRAHGLLVSKADVTARLKGVWLHSKTNSPWAIIHTVRKHKAQLADVVLIEVRVARKQLTRFVNPTCAKGIYYSKADISPDRLGAVIEATTFGASLSS